MPPLFFNINPKVEQLNGTPSFQKKFGPNLSEIHEHTENNLEKTLSREQFMRERRPSIVSQTQKSSQPQEKSDNTLNLRDSYRSAVDRKDKSEEGKHSSITSSRLSKEEKQEFTAYYQSTPVSTYSFKKKMSAPALKMNELPKTSPLRPRMLQYNDDSRGNIPHQTSHGSWQRRSSRQ